jgi:hypothetical protein
MSSAASLDLRIACRTSGMIIPQIKLIQMLIEKGWSLHNKNGYAIYLPINDNGMFNWESSKKDSSSILELLKKKEVSRELIGISFYWHNTNLGGTALFWNSIEAKKLNIQTPFSFSLSSERKLLFNSNGTKITNVNWYLERLLPIFNNEDTFVEHFSYEEQA